MSKPLKVLVISSTGSISQVFTKLLTLNSKHSFDLALILDSSNDPKQLHELLGNKLDIPIPTFISSHNLASSTQAQLSPNLFLLDKSGVLTLASGLKIATFSGTYHPDSYTGVTTTTTDSTDTVTPTASSDFTSTDLTSFIQRISPSTTPSTTTTPVSPPDILLTHCFPPAITNLSNKPLPANSITSNDAPPLDQLLIKSTPQYVFTSGKEVFWEREPYIGSNARVCRYFTLGAMGNKTKERWFYAFSITPNATNTTPPANATASPFSALARNNNTQNKGGMKRSRNENEVNEYGIPNYIFGSAAAENNNKRGRTNGGNGGGGGGAGGPPPDHYTCNICEKKGHWIQECPEKVERDSKRNAERVDLRKPIQPDECWFCLSNPKLTKHLIASIGNETYLTLPKGQLPPTSPESRPGDSPVPGGGHVLIIPIAHYPTLLSVPADLAIPIVSEIEKYKTALRDCYASFGASMVTFEVGRLSGKGGHAHIQICPIPNALADKVEECFRSEGQKNGIEFEVESSSDATALEAVSGITDNYFKVDLPDGNKLIHLIQPGKSFNLQFGRATLATLLGIQNRTDWKVCTKSDAEEKADAVRFKLAFKPFDPLL